MKNISVVLFIICLSLKMIGQNNNIEDEIRTLENIEAKAVLQNDTITLFNLWDKHYIVNSPDNVLTLAGKSVATRPVLQRNRIKFTREIEHIVIQENTAISMGNETVILAGDNSNSKEPIKRRFTNIWIKKEGSWKLVARHANVICK